MSYVRKHISAMTPYQPGEQPDDPAMVKLNTNENPYPPTSAVQEAWRQMDVDALRLYPDPLCRRLRDALGRLHDVDPDCIIVGNGSDELLAMCMNAFVSPGDAVGYFDPSYSLYPVLVDIHNARHMPVALDEEYRWQPPRETGQPLFLLTNPNAPTGMLFPRSCIESFCDRFQGVVLIDEAYVDFASGHCLDLALNRPNVLVARTLSKSYSLAGIRLGYIIGAKPLVESLYKIKDSYNINLMTQKLALAAINDSAEAMAQVEIIKATRETTSAALAQRRFVVYPSETNFLWVKPPFKPAAKWFRLLRERHILVRYFSGARVGDHLRITIGTNEQMNRLIKEVDEIIADIR